MTEETPPVYRTITIQVMDVHPSAQIVQALSQVMDEYEISSTPAMKRAAAEWFYAQYSGEIT